MLCLPAAQWWRSRAAACCSPPPSPSSRPPGRTWSRTRCSEIMPCCSGTSRSPSGAPPTPARRSSVSLATDAGVAVRTQASNEGRWSLSCPGCRPAGHTRSPSRGRTRVQFKDVLVGEVWVCSGQSNMEMAARGQRRGGQGHRRRRPTRRSGCLPSPRTTAARPARERSSGKWEECTPETVPDFSAVGYYFGRDLQKALRRAGRTDPHVVGRHAGRGLDEQGSAGRGAGAAVLPAGTGQAHDNYDPAKAKEQYQAAQKQYEEALEEVPGGRRQGEGRRQAGPDNRRRRPQRRGPGQVAERRQRALQRHDRPARSATASTAPSGTRASRTPAGRTSTARCSRP